MSQQQGQESTDGRQPHAAGEREEASAWRDAAPLRAGFEPLLVRRKVFRTWVDGAGRSHGRWTWDYV